MRNRPVPADWTTECTNCKWFLAVYGLENCYLFEGLLWEEGTEHVMNNPGVAEIPGANEAYWKEFWAEKDL